MKRDRIDMTPVIPWPTTGQPSRNVKYFDMGDRVWIPEHEIFGTVSRVQRIGIDWVHYLVVFDSPIESRAQFELVIGQAHFFADQLIPVDQDKSRAAMKEPKKQIPEVPRQTKTVTVTLSNLAEYRIDFPFPATAQEHAEFVSKLRELKPGMVQKAKQ